MEEEYEEQMNISDFLISPKVNVTTTINTKIKEWANRKGIDIARLIEWGFRSIIKEREFNKRINELEEQIKTMSSNIQAYQKRLYELNLKFEDWKKKYKIEENI